MEVCCPKRTYWARLGATDNWFKNVLNDKVANEEWIKNFRMNEFCVQYFCFCVPLLLASRSLKLKEKFS